MKFTFEADDIYAGLFIIRKNTQGKTPTDADFARTVLWKVCFTFSEKIPKYGICNVLTDGLYTSIGDTPQEVADYLNKDSKGYEPVSKEYMINLLKQTNQGFLLR